MDNEIKECNLDLVRKKDLLSRNATRKGTATMDQTLRTIKEWQREKGNDENLGKL